MATEEQLIEGLRRADAAGNQEDAQKFADLIRQQRGSQRSQPAAQRSALHPAEIGRGVVDGAGAFARKSMQGIGGAVGIVGDPILYGFSQATGTPYTSMRDSATALSDAAGLADVPDTPAGRVAGNVVEFGSGGGGFIGAGRAMASRGVTGLQQGVGRLLESAPRLQLASSTGAGVAGGVAAEMGAGPGTEAAATLAGGLSPVAAQQTGSRLARMLGRGGEQGRQQMVENINDFARAGVEPTLAQASPATGARMAEAVVRNAPGGAGRMRQAIEGQSEDLSRRVSEIASSLSTADGAERGGRAVIRGITGPGGFMERFRKKSGELYDAVEQMLPPGTQVEATNSNRVLQDLTTPIAGAQQTSQTLMNSRVAAIAEAFGQDMQAGGGRLPYDSLKRLRSQIGELISDSALSPDAPTRQMRALYGAMSDDLNTAARASGDPAVSRAVDRASNFYKAGMDRVEGIERVVERNGGPEAVYRALFAGSREGGTTLRRVMQSLDSDGRRDLAAVTLRRLGRANPGAQDELGEVFSPETFLTNWNRMSPEARSAMFGRFGTRFNRDMDAVVSATARMRDAARTLPNPSGTAPLGAQVTAYGALAAMLGTGNVPGAAGIGTAMGFSNMLARSFSNPRVVRWMAKQTELPPSAIPNQLRLLLAEGNSRDDQDAIDLAEALSETGSQGQAPEGQ